MNISEHIYKEGEVVSDSILITKCIRIKVKQASVKRGFVYRKGYICKCLKDEYKFEILEDNLKRLKYCPCCCGRVVVKGINDVATTHPYLLKYFVNPKEASTISYGSQKKVSLKCPYCNTEKEITMVNFFKHGIMCNRCGDGTSYPEKFIYELLSQLGVSFKTQLSKKDFEWCNNRKYDFYLPNHNIIIEANGGQHYKKTSRGRSLEEERLVDELKEILAVGNLGCKYIKLDCSVSSLDYIKNSVINSELLNLINFKEELIDWIKCHQFACSSRVKEACDLWNSGIHNSSKIGEIMNLSSVTVLSYLKQGKELNWCDYSVEKSLIEQYSRRKGINSKEVQYGEITYGSLKEFCQVNKVSYKQASKWLNGSRKMPQAFADKGLRYKDK